MRNALFCLMLSAIATPALAEIYRYTDARGNTVYTNQPPQGAGAEAVRLPPANTIDSTVPELPPAPTGTPLDEDQEPPYAVLQVTGVPDDNAALRANDGNIQVSAYLEPPLRPEHYLRFVLDGQPLATSGSDQALVQLDRLDRGKHNLQVEVVSDIGVVQRSPIKTFTLQRVHASSPAFQRKSAP